MELKECVETLRVLQSTADLEYASRFHVVGSRHYHGAALVNPHAFDLVFKEYELFKGETLVYRDWIQDGIMQLSSSTTKREYTVTVLTYTCSFFFMRIMLLPCRRIVFVRSNLKKAKLIPLNHKHPWWLLHSESNRPEEDETSDDISCSAFNVQNSNMKSLKYAVLSGSTQWRTGMSIAERVVETMSSQGTRSFLGMAEALRKFGEYATIVAPEGRLSFTSSKVSSGGELTDDSSALLTLKTKVKQFPDSSDEESGKDSDNREDIDSLAVKAAGYDDVPVEPVDMKRLVDTKVDNKNAKTQSAKDLKKSVKDPNQLVKTAKVLVKNPNKLKKQTSLLREKDADRDYQEHNKQVPTKGPKKSAVRGEAH
ncbi:hypothetical protein GQ600_20682 [Phytophthora cactorum]|nr:hypothetical protein GQ600_20682 [Phytophthora cactorum]